MFTSFFLAETKLAADNPGKVTELVHHMEDVLTISDQRSLKNISVEDLPKTKSLKRGTAKILVPAWQKGWCCSVFGIVN